MISHDQLTNIAGNDPQRQTAKQVKAYLTSLGVGFDAEDSSDGILLRLRVCPLKNRECNDRSYVIIFTDGGIHAGCHGGKCDGKGWAEFQTAWGQSFDDYLAGTGEKKAKKPKADPTGSMVTAAMQADTFFHWQGVGYVKTTRRGHPEVLKVREGAYRNILRLRFTDTTTTIAKREWLNNATEQLEAHAVENGEEHPVYVRVGYYDGVCYIDIGDTIRTIIQVTAAGWRTVDTCPVYFRRPKSMRALPLPELGGDLDLLRGLVNIAPADFPLYAAFLVMVYHPQGPFPLAAFIGGPGHAKSSTVRHTRQFVDPSNVTGGAQARNSEELLIGAQDRRLVTFDNLDHLTQQQSDDLCRLATGASFSRRTLFSDCDETTFVAKNPVVITSVKDVLSAADLIDRSIRFVLPRLVTVKDELVHDSEVEKAAPKILGLVLTGLASAIRNLPATTIDDPPRMVGFALWGTAAEEGLGLPAGSFMDAYRRNIGESIDTLLESDLAQGIIDIAAKGFRGRTKELALLLGIECSAAACKELIGQLRHLQAAMAKRGIAIDPDRVLNGNKIVCIARAA